MERIGFESNWRLWIRRESDHIVLLRAESGDECATLPDTLFSLPVTELFDHALAPEAAPISGEEVLLTCGAAPEEYNNRSLKELSLPKTLRKVGDYAFFNCRSLTTLKLYDSVTSWGGGVLMNCRELHRFHLTRLNDTQGESLAYLVGELPNELHVTIENADGSSYRLLFPDFIELYEENCPAHHFDYNIYGAGHPYHFVFREHSLSLASYDELFPAMLRVEHDPAAALRLAWWRIRTPYGLTEKAKAMYLAYLAAHEEAALGLPLEEQDSEGLSLLLSLLAPARDSLSAALGIARERQFTEASALLLEAQHRLCGTGMNKTFDL